MTLAAVLGGYGIAVGFLATLVHLASLKSFGVPYFEAFAPSSDLKDAIVRAPLWMMTKRPKDIAQGDMTRRPYFVPPKTSGKSESNKASGERKSK